MIRQLRVQNFKSLKDVNTSLANRNVLVGPNMSGKTNFISVFRFLNTMVLPTSGVYGLPHAVNSLGGFAELAWRGGQSKLVSIALEGDFIPTEPDDPIRDWSYQLDFVSDGRGHITVQEEKLTFATASTRYPLITKDADTGRRWLLSREKGRVAEVHDSSRSGLEFEIPDWEGNRLRSLFASFRFYNLIPQLMKQVNTTAAAPFLDEGGSNFSAWVLMLQTRYQEQFQRINVAAQGALPELANLFTYPTQQSTVFVASSEKHLKTAVPVWQMSDGELCFVAMLTLLFCPSELGAPAYFIEEPENHLHPRLVELLVTLLDQRESDPDFVAPQVFATTHSLELVDKSSLDHLLVFDRTNGATRCTRPEQKDHLRKLVSRQEIGLGDLYYSGALGHD
jgi:predicted ATPase